MMGGLARWLRAAGYRAEFDVNIEDGELVRRGAEEGKVLVTSDSGILDHYAVENRIVRLIYLKPGLSPVEQLARVLKALRIGLRDTRCMECGGALEERELEEVRESVPPRVSERFTRFFVCSGCGKVYWRGTHWQNIREKLEWAAERAQESQQ